MAASGAYRPFLVVAAGSLSSLLAEKGVNFHSKKVDDILRSLQSLPAHADASEAMALVRGRGLPIVALTNGSSKGAEALLKKANLAEFVEHIVSIDDVQAWKPRPVPYLRAAQLAGASPAQVALVAAHAWDCHGAKQAGLATG